MTLSQINYLNIGLIIISLIFAYILPFEVFLFAYAILGPLHYLTEISWLKDRSFFIKGNSSLVWILTVSAVLVLLAILFPKSPLGKNVVLIMFFTFLFSGLSLLIKSNQYKIIVAIAVLAAFYLLGLESSKWSFLMFGIFLPTIIHVYIFTGFFMISGALKRNSISGYMAFFVFVSVPILIFFFPIPAIFNITEYGEKNYSMFMILNKAMASVFGMQEIKSNQDLLTGVQGITIMRFIAFAYVYHYFNWFSKTSIIKWHEVSKARYAIIGGVWALSIGLYLYEYKMGFYWLYLLSMLHVFYEFPLNYISVKEIVMQLKLRLGFS